MDGLFLVKEVRRIDTGEARGSVINNLPFGGVERWDGKMYSKPR